MSRESVHVPPDYAAEMVPFDPLVGEFRVHYAGFFDPGFGHSAAGGTGSRAVLEVRSREVPFLLGHGQTIGRLIYERLAEPPDRLYGAGLGSNYQAQTLKLSKHFKALYDSDRFRRGWTSNTLRPVTRARWLTGASGREGCAAQHGAAGRSLSLLLLAGLPLAVYLDLRDLTARTSRQQALDTGSFITEVRNLYATDIVGRIQQGPSAKTTIAANYHDIPGAIPIPATFSILLGDLATGRDSAIRYEFVSDFPFARREPYKLTDFQQESAQGFPCRPNTQDDRVLVGRHPRSGGAGRLPGAHRPSRPPSRCGSRGRCRHPARCRRTGCR